MVIDKIKRRENDNENKSKMPVSGQGDIPVDKWVKCLNCNEIIYKETLHNNFSVCTLCGHHFRLSARRRISQIIDEGTFEGFPELNIKNTNPLNLENYEENGDISLKFHRELSDILGNLRDTMKNSQNQ